MKPERWAQIERIVHEALDRPAGERAKFVAEASEGDPTLGDEVTSLLREIEEDPGFLETPVGRVSESARWISFGEGDAFIGPYRVVRPLGRGGMGQVFLAMREEPRQHVAIKRIRRGLDTDDILARFRTERRILASLSHPNIARLFDVGADDEGRPYFVMEYVDGVPIDAYCDRHALGIPDRLHLFRLVCSAVQHAHQSLVIHRDLKPGNILVTDEGIPKLLDFGVGKVLIGPREPEVTLLEGRFFTPEYVAPEILRDEPVTTATDVYQLGLLLYELVCGRRPFTTSGSGREDWKRTVLETQPERPSAALTRPATGGGGHDTRHPDAGDVARARGTEVARLRKRLRGDLDTIVLKAIRSEPSERFASVLGLSEDLRRHLEGKPVTARPDTAAYRARKFIARNRVAVGAASIVFLSLLATTGVTLTQSARVRAESQRVARERDKAIQVKGFLLEALGNTGPDVPTGDSITARQLLDLRAATLEQEFGARPELKAEFLDVLAEGYDKLSLFDDAERHAREALRLRRELFGTEAAHADVATSLNTLGWILHQQGESAEAEPLLRDAVAMRRTLFPAGHDLLARSLNDLGVVREDQADYEEAEALYRESLAMRLALVGERHRGVAVTLSNLSVVLYRRGDLDEAIAMATRALDSFREVLGGDHQRSLIVQSNLAAIRTAAGDFAGAIELNRDALERRRRLLGPHHVQVGLSLGLLASSLESNGELAEAEALLREQVGVYGEWYGGPTTELASALNNLGSVLVRAGRPAEAQPVIARALAMRRDTLGIVDGVTAATLSNLAKADLLVGDTARAITHRREAAAAYRDVSGPGDWRTVLEQVTLGKLLHARGRADDARDLLERIRADLDGQPIPERARRGFEALESRLGGSG